MKKIIILSSIILVLVIGTSYIIHSARRNACVIKIKNISRYKGTIYGEAYNKGNGHALIKGFNAKLLNKDNLIIGDGFTESNKTIGAGEGIKFEIYIKYLDQEAANYEKKFLEDFLSNKSDLKREYQRTDLDWTDLSIERMLNLKNIASKYGLDFDGTDFFLEAYRRGNYQWMSSVSLQKLFVIFPLEKQIIKKLENNKYYSEIPKDLKLEVEAWVDECY